MNLYVTFKSTFSNLLINNFGFNQLHAKSSPDIIYGQSLNGSTDGEEPLEGNAHDDVCLAGHQDVLQRVEEVGEESDVDRGLEAEGVVQDDQEQEEDLHRGQRHQALVERGLHLRPAVQYSTVQYSTVQHRGHISFI